MKSGWRKPPRHPIRRPLNRGSNLDCTSNQSHDRTRQTGESHRNTTVINIEHTLIDNDTIDEFHERDIAVGTYTFFSTDPSYPSLLTVPEQEARIKELATLGVDWIETDDPERVLRLLG